MDSLKNFPLPRRAFLAQAGLGIATLGSIGGMVASLQGQEPKPVGRELKKPEPPGKRVGWAIAGIGKFATEQILPNIRRCEKTRVAGFITRDPKGKGQDWANRFGIAPEAVVSPDNIRALADREDIDVVYVITPNALHKEYTIAALEAGKHVLCEKPMAPTEADCQQMIDAAKKANRKLMIAYRSHFQPHNLAAIEEIRSGKLGTLRLINWENVRILKPEEPADAWRAKREMSGGGSLVDIGVYCLNGARYLTGEEPIRVSGQDWTPRSGERLGDVEEQISFQLHFPSGVVAQCLSSYIVASGNRARAYGDKGLLDLEPATAYEGQRLYVTDEAGRTERQISQGNQFAAMMDHFSECVRENKEPRTPGEDGLRDVRYMTAIYESARNNGAPIEVS